MMYTNEWTIRVRRETGATVIETNYEDPDAFPLEAQVMHRALIEKLLGRAVTPEKIQEHESS